MTSQTWTTPSLVRLATGADAENGLAGYFSDGQTVTSQGALAPQGFNPGPAAFS